MSNGALQGRQINSREDLVDEEHLQKIKLQNAISYEIIESKNNEKKFDDSEAMFKNTQVLNRLSQMLVKIFFGRIVFVLWIISYILLNIFLYYCLCDEASFYISLVDKIALFIIVCILGKFLKDNLILFIEIFKK